jgi:hypothetical protein
MGCGGHMLSSDI